MRKIWIVAVLLLLVSCYRQPEPVMVDFPGDPRILHGQWQLELTGRAMHMDFQFDSAARRVLLHGDQQRWAFALTGGAWQELAHAPAGQGTYDPTLDSWIRISRTGSQLSAAVADWDGPVQTHTFGLPAETTVVDTAAGSGRVFAVVRDPDGYQAVHWWSLLDGLGQGSRPLPTYREGMQQSGEGRFLSFWDLTTGRIHVLDTAQPEKVTELRLGLMCSSSAQAAADPAGRWFVVRDCRDRLLAHDLHNPEEGARNLGISKPVEMRFAADGSELLWLDQSLHIRGRDLTTGEQTVHHTISGSNSDDIRFHHVKPYLHRATGTFAFNDLNGSVTVETDEEVAVSLPPLPFATAELRLVAQLMAEGGSPAGGYMVSGELLTGADGERFVVSGYAYGGSHHVYRPQAAPPPAPFSALLFVSREGEEPDGPDARTISLEAQERTDLSYSGMLEPNGPGIHYTVRLQRPD